MSDTWKYIDQKDCIDKKRPVHNILFKYKGKEVDGWVQSNHKWCGSCYKKYMSVCKTVASEFKISLDNQDHWDENDLKIMVNKIYDETKDENYIHWLNNHTSKIKAIIDCINTRYYQHRNCFKYEGSIIKKPSEVSNEGHMRNLTTLCSSLLKLYILYEKKLKQYNDNHKNKKSNLLLELNEETANNCRNLMKGTELKEIIQDLSLTDNNLKLLETPKNTTKNYNSKRSRGKGKYKIPNTIEPSKEQLKKEKHNPKPKSKRAYNDKIEKRRINNSIEQYYPKPKSEKSCNDKSKKRNKK